MVWTLFRLNETWYRNRRDLEFWKFLTGYDCRTTFTNNTNYYSRRFRIRFKFFYFFFLFFLPVYFYFCIYFDFVLYNLPKSNVNLFCYHVLSLNTVFWCVIFDLERLHTKYRMKHDTLNKEFKSTNPRIPKC